MHTPDNATRLLGSEFPDDDGGAAPEVADALATWRDGAGDSARALAALLESRVLVPVVAVLGEVEYDEAGHAHDKTSDMATVLLTGADGRTALLAFTSMSSLQSWQADARPVPVRFRDAAKAAIQDGADAIVVDVAGPVLFVVEGQDLAAAAAGYELAFLAGGRTGWIAPD